MLHSYGQAVGHIPPEAMLPLPLPKLSPERLKWPSGRPWETLLIQLMCHSCTYQECILLPHPPEGRHIQHHLRHIQHHLPHIQHHLRHIQHHLPHVQHHLHHIQHHLRHIQDEAEMADDEDEEIEDEMGEIEDEDM